MRGFRIAPHLAVLALAVALGGCAKQVQELHNAWDVITASKVSPSAIVIAANTADAFEITGTSYLRLPKCTGSSGPVCRNPKATKPIADAVHSLRIARDAAEQFLRDHPGELGSQGLYDALKSANAAAQAIFAQYNIGSH